MIYIGIDPSLTGYAVNLLDDQGNLLFNGVLETKPAQFSCFSERLQKICDYLENALEKFPGKKLAAVEGYAFGARNGREQAGAVGEMTRLILWRANIEFFSVPPKTLKKFLGGGQLQKSQILLAVFKRWGYEAANDDAADAYSLAQFCREAHKNAESVAAKLLAKLKRGKKSVDET